MNCLFCNGKLKKSTVAYTVNRKGYHLYIEKVPALVCTQCGEKFFDEKETQSIQKALISFEKNIQTLIAA